MKVRFGYVAMSLGITNGSPNKTTTLKALQKVEGKDNQINKLRKLVQENLDITKRVLRYNAASQIHLYRFTSNTVPLATHPAIQDWNYMEEFKADWAEIGAYIQEHRMRVSAHPDHFTLLNSPRLEVLASALKDLTYHASLFDAMNLGCQPQLVLHIGGVYHNKEYATRLFAERFASLPDSLRLRLMLENDDKSFGTKEVLSLCQQLSCPMVLDIHHHACISAAEDLQELWPQIAATWKTFVPKIHLSSPKNSKDFRSHADFVNPEDFVAFLMIAKERNADFDVMIEAKQKDAALWKLMDDLEKLPYINRIEPAAIEV